LEVFYIFQINNQNQNVDAQKGNVPSGLFSLKQISIQLALGRVTELIQASFIIEGLSAHRIDAI